MFTDRTEAGQLLAKELLIYKNKKDILALAIPRGGVPIAYEIARQCGFLLDVVVIKKIGVPGNDELAAGATGLDSYILNEDIVKICHISQEYINGQVRKKQQEVGQRYKLLRGDTPFYEVKNKTIIIIDDGLATGATMNMAARIIKKQSPRKIIIAIPVAPKDTVRRLEKISDEIVCLLQPDRFSAIGQFYRDFRQVRDEEAKKLLQKAKIDYS